MIAANLGAAVSQSAGFNLETTVKNVDVVMVPSGSAGTITLSVTIDGKVYSTEVTSTTIKQGSCYTYTITVDAGALALSGVKVGDWGYSNNGSPTITAGGYTVTFDGDYEDLTFKNTVDDGTVTILACSLGDDKPKEVSVTGNVTTVQTADLSTKRRTITLSNIASDVTVNFQGLGSNFDKISTDGVYYVGPDGDYTATASSECIGVALISNVTGQRIMIEKYETSNVCYQGITGFGWYNLNKTINDELGITTYNLYTKVNSSYSYGYLPNKDGQYKNSSNRLGLPSTWPTASYALADMDGLLYYRIANQLYEGKSLNDSGSYQYMNLLVRDFIKSESALNFSDWFVPSCGQLALIYVYLTDINNALTAIGGTTFYSGNYWTSTEYDGTHAWIINMSNGYVNYLQGWKDDGWYRVRIVRNL